MLVSRVLLVDHIDSLIGMAHGWCNYDQQIMINDMVREVKTAIRIEERSLLIFERLKCYLTQYWQLTG